MTDLRLETDETLAWQEERNRAAVAAVRSLPSFQPFLQSMLARPDAGSRAPLVRKGGRWFQERLLDPLAEHPVLTVRSALSDTPRVLIDPNEIQAKRGRPVQMIWSAPSPNGAVVAYGITEAGAEVVEVTLLDVATGSPLPDEVPWSVMFPPSWLPDNSGFWCTGRVVDDTGMKMPLFRYLLGRPAPEDPVELPAELLFPRPQVSPDGRYVGIVSGNSEARLDYVVHQDGTVVPLLAGVPGGVLGHFVGDDLVAIVNGDAPRGRVVGIPVATAADASTWTELVPETDDVLCWLDVVDEHIVLGSLRDAAAQLSVLTLDGEHLRDVPLPGVGAAATVDAGVAHLSMPMFEAGEGEISFLYSDFATSWTVYRYDVTADRLDVVDPPAATLEGLTVTTIEAISADGTAVPAHVVYRADLDLTEPHPTLVTGYGGFGLSLLPSFLGNLAPWVQAGGIYVLSHLRGGGEKGTGWWRDGSREYKQHTFDDLFAVAERLIELGWTTPQQLAMYGGSNGGLLAGSAIAQRPDLFAAVVPDVPVLDLLELHRDPIGYAICKGEYGDPLAPEEAAWLRTYSPFEHLKPDTYPATLLIAGANDPRCAAWHSRVFLERLEQCQQGDTPLLLRVHADQGHGAAGVRAKAERTAEWLAFCAAHTGLAVTLDDVSRSWPRSAPGR